MNKARLFAAAATIALHAALFMALVAGLDSGPQPDTPEPLKIQLLAPEPALPPPPQPPAPPQLQPEKPAPRTERRARPTPSAPKPAPEIRPAPAVPAPDIDARPPLAATQPAPAVTPSPAPATAPARTSASEASYASTNRKPPYPRISLSNGDEGTVVLRVLVTAEGTAGAVQVRSSSGFPLLDESARKTVMTWRFKPATVDGKPVAEWYEVPIPFKLQDN